MTARARQRRYGHRPAIASCVLVGGLLGGLLACEREEPLRFAVLYEENHDLESGDVVVYKDMEVGRVTEVGLDENGKVRVDVQVEARYRGALAANSILAVERAGVLGGRQLVVTDGPGDRLPLAENAVLIGHEDSSPGVFDRLRTAGQEAMARIGELGADLERRLDDLQQSPEADELRAAMSRLGEQAAEGSERLRTEGVAAVRQRAAELQRKLEAEGKSAEARDLADRIERWLQQVEAPAASDGDR